MRVRDPFDQRRHGEEPRRGDAEHEAGAASTFETAGDQPSHGKARGGAADRSTTHVQGVREFRLGAHALREPEQDPEFQGGELAVLEGRES